MSIIIHVYSVHTRPRYTTRKKNEENRKSPTDNPPNEFILRYVSPILSAFPYTGTRVGTIYTSELISVAKYRN